MQGRLQEALQLLNSAIAAAPSYPFSYANRAELFQRLGMAEQAEADRVRARGLARDAGIPEEHVFAPPPPPQRQPPAGPRPQQKTPVQAGPPRARSARSLGEGLFVAVIGVLFVAGVGLGVVYAVNNVRVGDISFPGIGGDALRTPEPARGEGNGESPPAEPQPDPAPPPLPEGALDGSPYSFSDLRAAWQAAGISVRQGGISEGFSGFSATPFEVTLSREGATAQMAVMEHDSREAANEEWNLIPGDRPSPKDGRSVPAHQTIWWNANAVVLVRSGPSDLTSDAFNAFVNLG
jgi:hypothetical protein